MGRDREWLADELAELGYSPSDCVRLLESDVHALLGFYNGRTLIEFARRARPAWLRPEGKALIFIGQSARPGQPPLRAVAERLEDAAAERKARFAAQQRRA